MNPNPELSPPLGEALAVNVRQLAKMLGVSPRHVERLDEAGKLPSPIRLGRSKRWPLDGSAGIRAWIAAGCPSRNAMEGGGR